MIITRSPLRVSIGGGGTDLPSYYEKNGGFLIAMAIQKHVYVSLEKRYDPGFLLKYSQIESGTDLGQIRHPIIREALSLMGTTHRDIEITSVADVPAGTGLGSSGSFTTALLRALAVFHRRYMETRQIAELACEIEIDRLREPIGKQDQYIAAFGGLTAFTFQPDGKVEVQSLEINDATFDDLSENMLMFFTGKSRDASSILREQDQRSHQADAAVLSNLDRVKELGYRTRDAFLQGRLGTWGEIMREHWETKKKRSTSMSNPQIDEWFEVALRNGAIGGKVVGAGGGGFLMFYAEDARKLRAAMLKCGLKELHIRIDIEGTSVLTQ